MTIYSAFGVCVSVINGSSLLQSTGILCVECNRFEVRMMLSTNTAGLLYPKYWCTLACITTRIVNRTHRQTKRTTKKQPTNSNNEKCVLEEEKCPKRNQINVSSTQSPSPATAYTHTHCRSCTLNRTASTHFDKYIDTSTWAICLFNLNRLHPIPFGCTVHNVFEAELRMH